MTASGNGKWSFLIINDILLLVSVRLSFLYSPPEGMMTLCHDLFLSKQAESNNKALC